MLVDFHAVEGTLREIVAPLNNSNLNDAALFEGVNPSAEQVARVIGEVLSARLIEAGHLAPPEQGGVRVASVSVTEAPGCEATYRPELVRGG